MHPLTKIAVFCGMGLTGLTIILIAPLQGNAAPQTIDNLALKQELIAMEKQSWEAWQHHDGKFFSNFLSEDHVEVSFNGTNDKASIVAGVASGVCEVTGYTLDHFELHSLGPDTALLTYREDQKTSCQGNAVPSPCWVSSLFMKRGGRWQNILYQQTQIAK